MMSSGGVAPAAEAARAGAWSVLSGPAGGAVGAGLLARLSGDGDALGFDMGGTSCDVCVVEEGRVRRTDSRRIAGRVIQLPMVDVHTVGAGGGSIGWRDPGGALRVGPALGRRRARARLLRARWQRADGHRREPAARLPRRRLRARRRSRARRGGRRGRARARSAPSSGSTRSRPREGIVRVANQEMVRALRVVTVERGVDPRQFALLPFGGAGPMHAAAIAEELGIERILCPRASGVLSALGLLASERRRDTARTVMLERRRAHRRADRRRGRGAARADRRGSRRRRTEAVYELRYRGQAFELPVEGPSARARRAGRAVRRRARAPLRLPRSRGRGRAGQRSGSRSSSRPRAAARAAAEGELERGRPPRALRRRVARRRGAARRAGGRRDAPRARACSSSPRRRSCCRRAGSARSTRGARSSRSGLDEPE